VAGKAAWAGGIAKSAAAGTGELVTAVASSKAARATGGGLGIAGAVIAAGLIAERRAVRRARGLPDVPEDRRAGPVTGRATTVIASDGVPLHVVESGPGVRAAAGRPTLVFVHGFCNTMNSWCFQQRALADLGPMVFYDQRAHGRSGPSEVARCTIDQLADDLRAVLAACVPTGPIVLIGHSMGGMTILGLADRYPELFDERVVAVALLSTSAGELARVTFGLPAGVASAVRRVLPGLAVGMRHAPPLLERTRLRGGDLANSMTRRVGFGTTDVPPSVVAFLEHEIANTPIPVIMSFLPTLLAHDKLAAAAVLRNVPTLLMVGDHDLMTPLAHSRTLADALPEAELAVEEGAGHALPLERADAVNERVRALIGRAHPAQAAGRAPPPSRWSELGQRGVAQE
jgi:pimeloyl-ACP methyl ester carboxylesterase